MEKPAISRKGHNVDGHDRTHLSYQISQHQRPYTKS